MEKWEPRKKFWISDMEAVLAIVLVLLILGTINVFSSSFIIAETDFGTPYHFLQRQFMNLAAGTICFVIGCCVNYHRWRKWILPILGITLLSLLLVLLIGTEVNGSKRWLGAGGLQIQPAEIAKLVALMLISAYLASRVRRNQDINIFSGQFIIICLMGALIEKEPDGGTMFIVVVVPVLLMSIAGLSREKIIRMAAVMVSGIAALCVLQPYRLERVKILFNPWADAQNVGYQIVQSLSAIGSGGLLGMGLGMGVSKYNYLPEAHTDFAFAVFSQENGFLGVILVLFLYGAFTIYSARIANKAEDIYGQFLATGILLLISVQAVVNILMVAGVLPVIGVPLPFISYGGTSLIVSMASVGILLNIGYHGARKERLLARSREEDAEEKPVEPVNRLRLVKK